jgi:hypothetical protein
VRLLARVAVTYVREEETARVSCVLCSAGSDLQEEIGLQEMVLNDKRRQMSLIAMMDILTVRRRAPVGLIMS